MNWQVIVSPCKVAKRERVICHLTSKKENKIMSKAQTQTAVIEKTESKAVETKVATSASLIAERSKGVMTILKKDSTLFDGLHGVNPESVAGMIQIALIVDSESLVAANLKAVMDDLETMRNESIAHAKGNSLDSLALLTVENTTAGKADKRKKLVMKLDKKRAAHKNLRWFMRLHKAWIALNADL